MRLRIDGQRVGATILQQCADRLAGDLERFGAGPFAGVEVHGASPLTIVAAVLAARRVGATLVLGGPRPRPRLRGRTVCRIAPGTDDLPSAARCVEDRGVDFPAGSGFVFWTSGTTGTTKAVFHTPHAIAYQVSASVERMELDSSDELLVPLPLWHAYGFSLLQIALELDASLNLLSRLDVSGIARELTRGSATSLDGVPSMYRVLTSNAERDAAVRDALRRLKIRGCGGDRLAPSLAERFRAVVGAPLHDGYGLTEAGPNVALSARGCWRAGSVGRPLRGTSVRIDSHRKEILVRSPSVTSGYLDDDCHGSRLDESGYFPTGDTGKLDDEGFLFVSGRIKDVLMIHGESVAPGEIEEALSAHHNVLECVALGGRLPDEVSDSITAFVVRAQQRVSATDLAASVSQLARRSLPPGMRPRSIVILDEIPRLASGKVDKGALRTLLRARQSTVEADKG